MAKLKVKSGRKPRNLKASTMVGVRMSPDERARYQAAADTEKTDLSTWLRAAASERAGMVELAKRLTLETVTGKWSIG